MVMSAHVALPAVTGDPTLPATISREVMDGLLRRELGFDGVSITDAMDMKAVAQGSAGIVDSVMALRAGVDLLLLTPDRAAQRRLEAGLRQAALRGLLPAARIRAAPVARILRLRRWLAGFERPPIGVVRSDEHEALAPSRGRGAITLVRDDVGLLPLRPGTGQRVAVITPAPRDLTPADSSVDEPLDLAGAMRRHHRRDRRRARRLGSRRRRHRARPARRGRRRARGRRHAGGQRPAGPGGARRGRPGHRDTDA